MHPIDKYVGQQIQNARSLTTMSQGDLAEKVGVTFQQVQKYENGTNRVSCSRLVEIARAVKKPVTYFFPDGSDVAPVDETDMVEINRDEIEGVIIDLKAIIGRRKR